MVQEVLNNLPHMDNIIFLNCRSVTPPDSHSSLLCDYWMNNVKKRAVKLFCWNIICLIQTRTESVHKLRKVEKRCCFHINFAWFACFWVSCDQFCVLATIFRGHTPFDFFANFCGGSMWTTMQNLEVLAWKMTELCPF